MQGQILVTHEEDRLHRRGSRLHIFENQTAVLARTGVREPIPILVALIGNVPGDAGARLDLRRDVLGPGLVGLQVGGLNGSHAHVQGIGNVGIVLVVLVVVHDNVDRTGVEDRLRGLYEVAPVGLRLHDPACREERDAAGALSWAIR